MGTHVLTCLRRLIQPNHMQVLKDYKTSFYKAGLVPAANVYFSTGEEEAKGREGSYLRQEVLALEGPAPSDRGLSQQHNEAAREASRSAQVCPHAAFRIRVHGCQVLTVLGQDYVCL